MKTLLQVAREVLADLVKLNLPVTAAAAATAIVGYADLFGADVSAQSTRIAGALALLGLVVAYAQGLAARVRDR